MAITTTQFDYDLNGGAGNDTLSGGAGNDRVFGGAGDDRIDGGGGSDDLKGGSGCDTLVYRLGANSGAQDIYTGGSGKDTVELQLTQAEWTDPAVRAELQRYVSFLATVRLSAQGEVSNGIESDFVFSFANGTRLTVQMTEKLAVAVQDSSGQYVIVDHLAALITGTATGGVTEAGGVANGSPGVPSANGDLYADDLNGPDDLFQAVAAGAATANGYGSYGVTAAGVWTYTLNNALAAVQALNVGSVPLTDSFTVYSADGTSQVVSITIDGANDAAVITGTSSGTLVEAGGVANAVPGTPTATGDLLATDVDNPLDAFQAVAAGAATANSYGSYGVTAAGVWTYTLNNALAAVQALNVGSVPLTDSFTVLSADGTAQVVTVSIDGSNDAAVITGVGSGTVVEAGGVANAVPGTPTATGDLLATDVDNPLDAFQAVAAGAATVNGYGSYEVNAAGVWTYTLNNSNAAVQALNVGSVPLADSFTVYSADGTSQLVTVSIDGANDAAVITGTSIGTLVEAGGVANAVPGTPTATGDLLATDVDNPLDAFQAVAAGAATTNGYGSYGVTAAGVWTFTLDNSNAAVQALNVGSVPLTDSFTVYSADGTSQVVSITIDGANDAAVITGTSSGTLVEAGGVANAVPGTPTATGDLLATDVDNPLDAFQAVAAGAATASGYGSYEVNAAGVWTFTLNNALAAVQALNVGSVPLTDSFTVYSQDGTAQLVTVSIDGANDAAVITGTSIGTLVEAGGVANAVPGTPTATGDLLATDVDNPLDAFQAVAAGAATTNGYGSYGVTAAGVWTYTLNNGNAAVQALNVGSVPLTDSFTVYSADGTSQVIDVTVTGANDAATIGGTTSGAVTEDSPTTTTTGTLTASDADNTNNLFQAVAAGAATTQGYGTFGMTAAGVWTYTLNNSNPTVNALNTGGTVGDSFTVFSADGTSQVVNVTINGTTDVVNHAPTNITLTAVDYGNSLPGGGDTVATIVTTDPDAGDTHTYTVTGAAGFSASGSNLTVSASGMGTNSLYTIQITATDHPGGATYVETFNIITGAGGANTLPTGGTGLPNEDILYGLNNSDLMFGGAGVDTLFGQAGDDMLQGGDGNDTLYGGTGSDQFIFNTAPGASNVDTIADFVSGTDKIVLENAIFTTLAAGALSAGAFDVVGVAPAASASTRVVYDPTTGALWYDADGTGATAAVQIAVVGVAVHPVLASTDFVVV